LQEIETKHGQGSGIAQLANDKKNISENPDYGTVAA